MTVFRRFLLDRTRTDLWWALGIFAFLVLNIAFFPSVEGKSELDESLEDLPPALQELFGIQEGVSLGSAGGYLQSQLFAMLPVLLAVLGVAVASAALGGAEEDGSLEFLLAQPVSRRRAALERLAAVALVLAVHTAVITAAVFAMAPLFGALDGVDLIGLVAACVGSGALALLHSAVAFTAGAHFGRRNPAIAVASAVTVGGYVAQGLLAAIDAPEALRFLSPWYWFLRENMLVFGPNLWSFLPALALATLIGLAAVPLLERRDLRG
jgi:ABC-2 type transport system permease protein